MSNEHNEDFQANTLDLFLDGMLSGEARTAFLRTHDPTELAKDQAVQNEIDASLRSLYQFEPFDSAQEQELARQAFRGAPAEKVSRASQRPHAPAKSSRPLVAAVLAASLLAITASGLWWMNQGSNDPVFVNRPVASLYQETVKTGFRPYYNCEDDQRFSDTFKFRHGIALKLAEMPEGTRMLGLSYLGGMSRGSTAMLGEVDGEKVIVFVDNAGSGKVDVSAPVGSGLNVFIEERDGLTFAEVTPLGSPKLIEFFECVKP